MASLPQNIKSAMDVDGSDSTAMSREELVECYRLQVLARTFDEKAVSLHRQGRIGTYAPLAGHEATQVGAAMALSPEDYCFPTYRDHAIYLARGVDLASVLTHLRGAGNYVDRADPETVRTFPPTIPIATHLPHAVGVGMAADYHDDDVVALASFGDGATSEGDFHEALNFAGVFDAPVVFLCQNNGYAISTPFERQTASEPIAIKADAYGIEGVRVDGTDLLAVYETVSEALARAGDGDGPTLVEAVAYRTGAHTTTDDPTKYRDESEAEEWPDPNERTRQYLVDAHGWTDEADAQVHEWADDRVQHAVEEAETADPYDLDDAFENVYARPPASVLEQREEVVDDPSVRR